MIAFALLIPPALLASVLLLDRFEERMFAPPKTPQAQLRLVAEEHGQPETPLSANQAA
ncbi:hypothetical protein [Kitasatospora mediocidica]|uniref:hypothetical protein n=1 Tax=Kitasatospora mediocidica TaxID=58352 RepID=UPI000A75BAB4|nr:hypothetical protein [Kitasatospora mediocidica]